MDGFARVGYRHRRGCVFRVKDEQFSKKDRGERNRISIFRVDAILFLLEDPIKLAGLYPILFSFVDEGNRAFTEHHLMFFGIYDLTLQALRAVLYFQPRHTL